MSNKEIILNKIKENNGIVYSKDIVQIGIDNKILQRLCEEGIIERVERGIYIDSNIMEDNYLLTQYKCKKGIFSHETALFFHDLSDRIPFQLTLTVPSGYNTRILTDKIQYKFYYVSTTKHEIGKMTLLSPYGNKINVYDKERTICDCISKKEQLDKDLVISAIKKYIKGNNDFAKLIKYAEIFNIRSKVKEYLEVLT